MTEGNGKWERRPHRGRRFAEHVKPHKDQRRRGRGGETKTKYKLHGDLNGQHLFVGKTVRVLDSFAMRALSASDLKMLNCLELYLLENGRRQKDYFAITYERFIEYGISRRQIPGAIRALEALKLIRCRHGKGNTDQHFPNMFYLPYVHAMDSSPSYEWDEFKSLKEAKAVASLARNKEVSRPNGNNFDVRKVCHRASAESGTPSDPV